jgi:hypothetical protein
MLQEMDEGTIEGVMDGCKRWISEQLKGRWIVQAIDQGNGRSERCYKLATNFYELRKIQNSKSSAKSTTDSCFRMRLYVFSGLVLQYYN